MQRLPRGTPSRHVFDMFDMFFLFDMIDFVSYRSVHEEKTFQKTKQDSCKEKRAENCVSSCEGGTS